MKHFITNILGLKVSNCELEEIQYMNVNFTQYVIIDVTNLNSVN